MKAVDPVAAFTAAAMIVCWDGAAQACRRFDGTAAAVAETGEIEIEFGPVEYLRQAAERELFAPDLRVNYGFTRTGKHRLRAMSPIVLPPASPGRAWLKARLFLNACCGSRASKAVVQPSSYGSEQEPEQSGGR
jgi:hypothetical protein